MSHQAFKDVSNTTSFDVAGLFEGPPTRRRLSLGQADGHGDRDPEEEVDDLQELIRAAMERVSRRSFKYAIPKEGEPRDVEVVDIKALTKHHREFIVNRALGNAMDQDNEALLAKFEARAKRVGADLPTVEVRFRNLDVRTSVYLGNRAMPTLLNSYRNQIEDTLIRLRLMRGHKMPFTVLEGVTGVLKPGRMTLLLGPPGGGKTTLLKALAGKLRDSGLKVSGDITYNGETFASFVPQRTAAYVDQTDVHTPDLTVRETFDFAARCQGVTLKKAFLEHLREKEKEHGIEPDPYIDAFMRATAVSGKRQNIVTNYVLRVLGLEVCEDTFVGNDMIRGISGGQKKRVTTGERIVGPAVTLFLDEISTGLDSSTTFLIVRCIRNFCHMQQATVLMALLQPAPEVFNLFDDIMLLCEGHVVFHGPREDVLPFFGSLGYKIPERKGIADFLQEVTSKKDQGQYWSKAEPHEFQPVAYFANAYKESSTGKRMAADVDGPPVRKPAVDPLQRTKFALTTREALRACFSREFILVKRHMFIYVFRTFQTVLMGFVVATLFIRPRMGSSTVDDGNLYAGLIFYACAHMLFDGFTEMALQIESLPVFFKQRDNLFFPVWTFDFPVTVLRIPYSLVESFIWSCLVYYPTGLASNPGRFFSFWMTMLMVHQMAVNLFRLMGALGRTLVVAYTISWLMFLLLMLLNGFILAKNFIHPWYIGGYWALPLQWLVTAALNNEFTAARWKKPNPNNPSETLGEAIMGQRDVRYLRLWVWVGWAVAFGWILLFNVSTIIFLKYLDPLDKQTAVMPEEALNEREETRLGTSTKVANGGSRVAPILEGDSAHKGDIELAHQAVGDGVGNGVVAEKDALGGSRRELRTPTPIPTPASPPSFQRSSTRHSQRTLASARSTAVSSIIREDGRRGMVLPFQPLSLVFNQISYSVDSPTGQGDAPEGGGRPQLMLLRNVSGAFRPGVLTCLMGVSGAGKTTLMDVLAGRKTTGHIRGDITVGGFPKDQTTFARVSGYVEQFDIHTPAFVVREALQFSAKLRLSGVEKKQMEEFVDEVMELMELTPLRNAMTGLPGVNGLSVEQRKRLTIAVELVANPSIIFMDEPTSGLDARAAAIVMRTVKNTVLTGRTVVCTIHQPSIDIFEAFDELLLLKRGGRVIYNGPTGRNSAKMVHYFEQFQGVPHLVEGINPATWMLEVTNVSREEALNLDFADLYESSELARKNESMVAALSQPQEGAQPLHFDTVYARNAVTQFRALLQKNFIIYWRSPQYNGVRYFFTIIFGLVIGSIYWRLGNKRSSIQNLSNVVGALLISGIFLGTSNASTVQPVVSVERTVFYRERAAGLYSAYPFALAQAVVEFPYLLVQTILYSIITYFMIWFYIDAAKFFWYFFFTFLTLSFFTFYGQMAVAITPNVQMAAIVSSFAYSAWFLFGGFIIPRSRIPGWWIWFYWLDPLAHSVYGLVATQLGDVNNEFLQRSDGTTVSVAQYLRQNYGFKHSFIGYAALVLIGFMLAFHLITAYALMRINFQKR